MFTARKFIYSAVALSVISCGGGSSSSDRLELPSFVSLIQEQQAESKNLNTNSNSNTNSAQSLASPLAVADPLPGAGTNFDSFTTTFHGVQNPSDAILKQVNGALCFVNQTNPQDNVGGPAYRSLVDEGTCFGDSQDTTYQDVIAKVTSVNGAYQIDLWWAYNTAGTDYAKVRFLVNESVSDTNPYGRFELFMLDENNSNSVKQHLTVDVDSEASESTHVFKVVMDDLTSGVSGSEPESKSIAKTAFDGSSGGAKIRDGGNNSDVVFNGTLIQHNQANANTDVCFDRTDPDEEVFGYALFTPAGVVANLESGFGFSYIDGGTTTHGFVDRYGAWPEDVFTNADSPYTVTRHSNNETYTLTVDGSGGAAVKDASDDTVEFGDPIEFTNVTIAQADMRNGEAALNSQTLTYFGQGSMGNPNGQDPYNLKDGYEMNANSIDYIVKATDVFLTAPQTTSQADCDSLEYPDYETEFNALTIGADSSYNTATVPVVTTAPIYVGGETVATPTGS